MLNAPQTECPGCGRPVDPLRAGQVAILDSRFFYFCGPNCKAEYLQGAGSSMSLDAATAEPPEVQPIAPSEAPFEPPAPEVTASRPSLSEASQWRPGPTLAILDIVGVGFGFLVPAVELLGGVADALRLPFATLACVALVARAFASRREPCDAHPSVVLGPTVAALFAAVWASLARQHAAVAIAVFAGMSAAAALLAARLVDHGRARILRARESIARDLDVRVHVFRGEGIATVSADEVRSGEEVAVEPGELVGVDATVTGGEARVVPWLGAAVEVVRREGDPIVAGARVLSGRLRVRTTWSGKERAWLKLMGPAETRIDVAGPTARALRLTVERGAPLAAALVGLATLAASGSGVEVLASMAAAAFVFGGPAIPSFVGIHLARAHHDALANGIAYKDARAFERAGAADIAVLSARGTVLLGEPEIVGIELLGPTARAVERVPSSPGWSDEIERVLALASGAETASNHPFAAAILRAARTRGVRPDPVRNAIVHAGLGVTALAASGERLVVGGRAIMLEQKIGGAMADARVSELEAQGRSVLLVALGDRMVGLIALQDGLRPGARAAVQKLLDARIEPVLLSGEARDTCETLGRALDVEHVRPEVLPADRGAEVRALGEGGAVVAVLGHAQSDDAALGAADVAVALGAAGSTPGEWAVSLASDDVQNAALALAIAHRTRARVWVCVALGAAPGVASLLTIGFGLAPLATAPLGVLVGVVAAAAHARESARA